MSTEHTAAGDGGATRRNVLKGATAPVGAFIALEAIGGVSLAAGASPKSTALSNGVIYPDPTLCIGCLTCEVICSQVHKQAGLSDLPRIRIYNDPTTKVDPEVLAAYPGRGSFHQEPCLQCPSSRSQTRGRLLSRRWQVPHYPASRTSCWRRWPWRLQLTGTS